MFWLNRPRYPGVVPGEWDPTSQPTRESSNDNRGGRSNSKDWDLANDAEYLSYCIEEEEEEEGVNEGEENSSKARGKRKKETPGSSKESDDNADDADSGCCADGACADKAVISPEDLVPAKPDKMHEREGMPSYEELLQFWKINARPMRCNSIHCESQCCALEKPSVIEEHKTQGPPPPPQPRHVPTGAPLPWSDAYLKLMEKIGDITQLLWSSGLEYRVYSKVEKMLYNTVEELYPEVIDYRQEFIKDVCIIPETLSPFPRNKPKTKSTKKKDSKTRTKKTVTQTKPSAEHHGPPPQIARPRKRQAYNDNGLYQCEYCERTFPTPQGIQSHITLSHANMQSEEDFDRSTGMHKCQFCRRLFPQEHGLKTHISCTHLQKVYKCPECGKGFPKKYAMIRHRSTHVNKDFMPQKCPYCDAMVSVRYYKSHIFTRHLYKTFKCEDCHQTFNNQDQFHKHLWTHPMKKYRCDQCPMSFNASYKLDNHHKTHEADNKALGDFKDDKKVQELINGAVECEAVEEFEGDISFNEVINEVMVTS